MPSFEFRISNSSSKNIAFYLEPWGGKYKVPPHSALRIVIESPGIPELGWEFTDDVHTFAVYDPPGTLATVYDGENQVRAE